MKIFKPEVFQGNLNKKNYFEGWYYKHVSADFSQVYSFIPGISLNEKDPHAFIQIINGITGKTHYITYKTQEFEYKTDTLWAKVGNSVFTENYIDLDIQSDDLTIKGRLTYNALSKYPKSLLSPGIMGWYSYMPFMECYHGVVSANHFISGKLMINEESVDFNRGKGYIEKDWGTSFPECWIWLQSNSFQNENSSLFVSIAKIPWLGKYFMGFIAFLYHEDKYHKFCTYNNAKLQQAQLKNDQLNIALKNRKHQLKIEVKIKNTGELIAPHQGNMERMIKESIDSEVSFTLTDKKGTVLLKDQSQRAGLEIIEKIFTYL